MLAAHLKGVISVDGESSGLRGLFLEDPNIPFLGLDGLYMAGCGSQASSRELRFSKTCHQHTTLHLRRKVSLFLESDFELNATNLGTKKIWALVQFFSPLSSQPFPLTMLPLLKLQQPLSYVSGVCVCAFEPCELS